MLGLVVLGGWVAESAALIRSWPGGVAVRFNVGLCLLAAGLAVALLAAGLVRPARMLGAALAVVAVITLAQDIIGVDLGLDEALVRDEFIDAEAGPPGRMLPDTALAFALVGGAVVLAPWSPAVASLCLAPVAVVGGFSLAAHWLGTAALPVWAGFAPMAIPTALALLVLAVGAASAMWRRLDGELTPGDLLRPAAIAFLGAVVAVALWRALAHYQTAALATLTRLAGEEVNEEVTVAVRDLAAQLAIIGAVRPDVEGATQGEVRVLATLVPGLLVLESMAPDDSIRRRLFVREGAALDVARLPRPPARPRAATGGAATAVGSVFRDADGRAAVWFVVRNLDGGATAGMLRLGDLLPRWIVADERYAVEVEAGGIPIYRHGNVHARDLGRWRQQDAIVLPGDAIWGVTMAPTLLVRTAARTALPEAVLVTGLLVSLLLGTTVLLARRTVQRARAMAHEIAVRRRAEAELRSLTEHLEERVAQATGELQGANTALRTENILRRDAQAELEQSNRDLQQFAAFMSHELKQPLATMAVWIDLIASSAGTPLGDKAEGYLERLRATIDRLARLIDGELALAQVGFGEAPHEPVELSHIVREVATDLAPSLERARARIDVGDIPVIVGDPVQIRRVVWNLIENAIKYRRPDVPLHLRVEGEICPGDGGDPRCVVRVQDNGRGFTPEQAEHVFEMFRRVGPSTIRGSGIGLAVCRRIVERHGGSISAMGRPGEGATFTITLRRAHPGRAV